METINFDYIKKYNEERAVKNSESYLTEQNIRFLKRMFKDESAYIKYMETLWTLRALTAKACEIPQGEGVCYDKKNPIFRITELTNELIGALLNDSINFSFDGERVNHWKTY